MRRKPVLILVLIPVFFFVLVEGVFVWREINHLATNQAVIASDSNYNIEDYFIIRAPEADLPFLNKEVFDAVQNIIKNYFPNNPAFVKEDGIYKIKRERETSYVGFIRFRYQKDDYNNGYVTTGLAWCTKEAGGRHMCWLSSINKHRLGSKKDFVNELRSVIRHEIFHMIFAEALSQVEGLSFAELAKGHIWLEEGVAALQETSGTKRYLCREQLMRNLLLNSRRRLDVNSILSKKGSGAMFDSEMYTQSFYLAKFLIAIGGKKKLADEYFVNYYKFGQNVSVAIEKTYGKLGYHSVEDLNIAWHKWLKKEFNPK
ncbi:MAG: hypothetical protein ABH822_01310 [Patescibacteria group bacterium]